MELLQRIQRNLQSLQQHAQKTAQPEGRFFCIAEMDDLYLASLKSSIMDKIIANFLNEVSVCISEIVLRPNRNIIEVHNLESKCTHCSSQLPSCVCNDMLHITDTKFIAAIQEEMQKMYLSGKLLAVYINPQGLCKVHNYREVTTERYFSMYGMGKSFERLGCCKQ